MKINVDTATGGKTVEIDLSTIDDKRLDALARVGSTEAREELKRRVGFDPYKPIEEFTKEDVRYYKEWLKNSNGEKHATIDTSSKDVE